MEFIAKYWLEFVFGLIALGMTGVAKHFYNLVKDGKQLRKNKEEKSQDDKTAEAIDNLRTEIREDLEKHRAENAIQNKKIDSVMQGILALWKRVFMEDGEKLLQPTHRITYDEFMDFTHAHVIYNNLGGNSEGDELYQMVSRKYHAGIAQD